MNRVMFHVVVLFPKFSDLEVVALSLTAETESIDSEKWLFDYKLQEYKDSIPNHSTNLRLTVKIHSTFSRVVQIYALDRGLSRFSMKMWSLIAS